MKLPVVFVGEVIGGGLGSVKDDPWNSERVPSATFRVIEAFRGVRPGTKSLSVKLETFTARDIDSAPETVRYVRDWFGGRVSRNVHGQAAVFAPDSLQSLVILPGEAKLLPGSRVIAQRGGFTAETLADREGRYILPLPSTGKYALRVVASPYSAALDEEIEIAGYECIVRNLAALSASTVSGRVTTVDGKPVRGAEVYMVEDPVRGNRMELRALTGEDGAYVFAPPRHVLPIGRFLVAVNPDKPVHDGRYEPSFHRRAIQLRDAKTHLTGVDIVVGREIPFRAIGAKVRFADGSPLSNAVIEAAFPSRPSWRYLRRASLGDLMIPAEAPVRVSVRDAHGRDLGAKYEAEFPAGTSRIEHEFVIQQ